jgi:hypothetical protein
MKPDHAMGIEEYHFLLRLGFAKLPLDQGRSDHNSGSGLMMSPTISKTPRPVRARARTFKG